MPTHSQLHYIILKTIVEQGFAPDNTELAAHFHTTEDRIVEALYSLQEYHGVVLHPNEPKVWVIHPFSLAPTNFYVRSEKGQWWGNCAWCSLGVAALLGGAVTITTSIGAEGKPVEINIEDGEVKQDHLWVHFPIPMKRAWDNVIYTCSNMLIFESESQVDEWSARHQIARGDVQPIGKIWKFTQKWYGNHLDPNWVKWTVEEASQLFKEFGLHHAIWDLDTSGERF